MFQREFSPQSIFRQQNDFFPLKILPQFKVTSLPGCFPPKTWILLKAGRKSDMRFSLTVESSEVHFSVYSVRVKIDINGVLRSNFPFKSCKLLNAV